MSDKEFITNDMQLFYNGVYYAIGGKRNEFSAGQDTRTGQLYSIPTHHRSRHEASGNNGSGIILGVGFGPSTFSGHRTGVSELLFAGQRDIRV
jgi:hypothetical protein